MAFAPDPQKEMMERTMKATRISARGFLAAAALATMGFSAVFGAMTTQAEAESVHGYPVCVYRNKAAFDTHDNGNRTCLRLGQYSSTGFGQFFGALAGYTQPYVDVKGGYAVEVFNFAHFDGTPTRILKDGVINGPIRSIKIHRRDIGGIGGYPVCLYWKRSGSGTGDDRACFAYGEYPTFELPQFHFFDNRASYIDVKKGFRIVLYRDPNFRGSSQAFTSDTKLSGGVKFNNRASSLRIEKIGVPAKPGPEWKDSDKPDEVVAPPPPPELPGPPDDGDQDAKLIGELTAQLHIAVQEGRIADARFYQQQIVALGGPFIPIDDQPDPPPPPPPGGTPPGAVGQLMCVSVPPNDVLNIRSGPGASYQKVGHLPNNLCEIYLTGTCQGKWCEITALRYRGWVHTRYLIAAN
jgi:hypothetical protein